MKITDLTTPMIVGSSFEKSTVGLNSFLKEFQDYIAWKETLELSNLSYEEQFNSGGFRLIML